MSFSIVAPSFLREYIDLEHPEKNENMVRYIISPHSVDYVVMLRNRAFCKRLLTQSETIRFTMTEMQEEDAQSFNVNADALLASFPGMTHYWPIRQMMMYILQFSHYSIDRRMLMLNHCVKVIDGMQQQFKADMIPQFCAEVTHKTDFTDVFNYFDKLPIALPTALAEGVGVLKLIYTALKDYGPKETFTAYKHVYERVFKGLGISGPETLGMTDMKAYVDKRQAFAKDLQGPRSYILENLLVNYLWEFAVPFTDPSASAWENFTFYVNIYNALKILLVTVAPADDDDMADIISTFDAALNDGNAGNRIFLKIVTTLKHQNKNNNGDMAVLAIS
jgi:hypothetical protein